MLFGACALGTTCLIAVCSLEIERDVARCEQPSHAAQAGCFDCSFGTDLSVDHLMSAGETLLEEAVLMSAKVGLVRANDHIVCVQRIHESYVVKIVSVNDKGTGIQDIRPKSLIDMMKVRLKGSCKRARPPL